MASRGFIYYVSITGITGSRLSLDTSLQEAIEAVRRTTDKPVAVGFGITTPAQARAVGRLADGVIVGSAIVAAIARNAGRPGLVPTVSRFVHSLARAVA